MSPADQAAELLLQHGAPEAWQIATRNAIDARISGDEATMMGWMAVQQALRHLAPRPAPGDIDVYRAARLLIEQHGPQGATQFAEERMAAHAGDVMQQALSERVIKAVLELTEGPGRPATPGH